MSLLMQKQCTTLTQTKNILKQSEQEVTVWRDKEGRSRAKVEDISIDYSTYKITQQAMIDSLKSLGIKKKIIYIAGAETVTVDTLSIDIVDTVYVGENNVRIFDFEDEWTKIHGEVFLDRVDIVYNVRNYIRMVSYNKGFFKRRTIVEAISENPNVEIVGMTSLSIKNRKRFSVGPQVGFTYYNGSIKPYFGFGVS